MSPPDAPRDRPTPARHLADRPPAPGAAGAGAFGPPLDPPVYLSEEGLLHDEPGERATAGTRLSPTRASTSAPAPTTPAAPGETEGDRGDHGDGPGGGGNGRGGSGGNGHGPGDGELDPVDDREADDRDADDREADAEAEAERRYGRIANLVDLGIVLACCLFVFL